MGFFDRFTSSKGKDQTSGPKRGVVKETKSKGKTVDAEKKAFANVPSGKAEAKVETSAPAGKGKTAKTDTAPVKTGSDTAHLAHAILVRPIVTEKSTRGGAQSQYTFEVKTNASKADVRRSVHHLYGVTPVSVNMSTKRGKVVRFGRTYGRTANSKKAIVTLPAGKTIDVVSA